LKEIFEPIFANAKKKERVFLPEIAKVIFNPPATIVYWEDGTKTVVQTQPDEEIFDHEKGLAMAISKKAFGNSGSYFNRIKKWLPEDEESSSLDEMIDNFVDTLVSMSRGR